MCVDCLPVTCPVCPSLLSLEPGLTDVGLEKALLFPLSALHPAPGDPGGPSRGLVSAAARWVLCLLQMGSWRLQGEVRFPRVLSDSSVVADSVRPHRLQPARLLCPWGFLGKSAGVGAVSVSKVTQPVSSAAGMCIPAADSGLASHRAALLR